MPIGFFDQQCTLAEVEIKEKYKSAVTIAGAVQVNKIALWFFNGKWLPVARKDTKNTSLLAR